MSKNILYLFPDTNFFIHYKNPNELSWTDIGEFEEIRLIVTMPVLTEIDELKFSNKNRVQKRARQYTSQFEKINRSENAELKVSDSPSVILKINLTLERDHELLNEIGSENQDNILASIANKYANENSDKDVRLLTGDVVLSLKAREHSIPCFFIPDSWRRERERSKVEKENESLKKKIELLQADEPLFEIQCVDENDEVLEEINTELIKCKPLTENEVKGLVKELMRKFPQKTNFGKTRNKSKYSIEIRKSPGMVYEGPTEPEINKYEKEYDEWIDKCLEIVISIHEYYNRLQLHVWCDFKISNKGSRPGKDVLVDIIASGDFHVKSKSMDEDNRKDETKDVKNILSSPPVPPQGRWVSNIEQMLGNSKVLSGSLSASNALQSGLLKSLTMPHFIEPEISKRRDSNAFYFKDYSTLKIGKSFSLECAQFRHGGDDKYFPTCIIVDKETEKVSGLLKCTVHAANLSRIQNCSIPVTIAIKTEDTYERVLNLIRQ